MSTVLVTYDLRAPGRNYAPVHDYLKRYVHCKGLESVWLLDTAREPSAVRDELRALVDPNDKLFVVRITRQWASWAYGCADWLNRPERSF